MSKQLLVIEREQHPKAFKFGVIYAKAGQTTDVEYFANGTAAADG